jgi:hypothetical protein
MVSVIDDLKGKLAEGYARLATIREETATLKAKKSAFESVIAVYDPGFAALTSPESADRPLDCGKARHRSPKGQGRPRRYPGDFARRRGSASGHRHRPTFRHPGGD